MSGNRLIHGAIILINGIWHWTRYRDIWYDIMGSKQQLNNGGFWNEGPKVKLLIAKKLGNKWWHAVPQFWDTVGGWEDWSRAKNPVETQPFWNFQIPSDGGKDLKPSEPSGRGHHFLSWRFILDESNLDCRYQLVTTEVNSIVNHRRFIVGGDIPTTITADHYR